MTTQQRDFLNGRLRTAKNVFIDALLRRELGSEPANIKAARKMIASWERERSRLKERMNKRVARESQKVSKAILFDDPKDALKALDRFERMKF